MNYYRVDKISNGQIQMVEVERETEQSVWIKGRRKSKSGDWEWFFPTWKEAHAFLLRRAEVRLSAARWELQLAQGHYGNVQGMKEPQETA